MLPLHPNRSRLQQYGHLLPFLVLGLYGLTVLGGWLTGNLSVVQPRSYDAPLPANAGVCIFLIGLTPIALAFGWRRTGFSLGLVAGLVAWATLIQGPMDLDLGIDNLIIRHDALIAGANVARMPAAL